MDWRGIKVEAGRFVGSLGVRWDVGVEFGVVVRNGKKVGWGVYRLSFVMGRVGVLEVCVVYRIGGLVSFIFIIFC